MNKIISGKVFVLGDDIDTDQIIPAQHLVYSLEKPEEKKMYGKRFFGPSRSAYCIDASGKVLGIVKSVDPARHAQQLLELVRQ